jgi:hypothetical protein
MRIVAWVRRQRDRPIAEHERRAAMAAVVVLLAAFALLFTLTQPPNQAHGASGNTTRGPRLASVTVERHSEALTPEAEMVAERFLAGYLGYAYGHTSVSKIADASRSLLVSLESHPPRVLPAARAHRPRLVSLHAVAAPVGEVAVRATVNDGELTDYAVGLVLSAEHGRLLVCGLDGA